MTDKQEFDTVFFNTFMGETIFITSTIPQTNRVVIGNDMQTETIPLCIEGVLMDMDEENLYLGDGKKITSWVQRIHIFHAEIKEEEDPYKTLLDNIPGPIDDTEFN